MNELGSKRKSSTQDPRTEVVAAAAATDLPPAASKVAGGHSIPVYRAQPTTLSRDGPERSAAECGRRATQPPVEWGSSTAPATRVGRALTHVIRATRHRGRR